MLTKHKKVTARNITISKLNHRDTKKSTVFEDRIPLGREVYQCFADQKEDDRFYGKIIVRYPNGESHIHVELFCDTGDNYEVIPAEDLVIDCIYQKPVNDEENMEVEDNQSVAKETFKRTIPNTVDIHKQTSLSNRDINEAFEGFPKTMAESRKG